MSAVPNFGGSDSQGATGFKIMGDGPIPTPRQLVAMLDQYVIGQDKAKRVSQPAIADVMTSSCHDRHVLSHHPCLDMWKWLSAGVALALLLILEIYGECVTLRRGTPVVLGSVPSCPYWISILLIMWLILSTQIM